jgi:glycosyltransferase involved in cell wall biosynthesis
VATLPLGKTRRRLVEPGRPLNILQVNTFDINGGAARTAWNMFRLFQKRGHRSWLAVGIKRSTDPDVFVIPSDAMRSVWAKFWLSAGRRLTPLHGKLPGTRRITGGLALLSRPGWQIRRLKGLEDFDFPGTWRLASLPPQRPDIIHAHNLHGGFFDLRALPALSEETPFVLTLHDSWLLSGHCAHSLDCERWKTGCGHCPYLTIYPSVPRDATADNLKLKAEICARSHLFVATPSQWLMRKVEQSVLAPAIVDARIIPNGVDLDIFRPGPRLQARDALGLPRDAAILLAVGNKPRSGWRDYLTLENAVKALADRLPEKSIILLYVGEKGDAESLGRAKIRFVEYQPEPASVTRYYQAADVYIHNSKADTFPNTVLEAQACGTPVIAMAVGGVVEQIKNGYNGFLVPPADPEAITTRTEQILTDPGLFARLKNQSIDSARRLFDLKRQADDYLKWYYEIIGAGSSAPV